MMCLIREDYEKQERANSVPGLLSQDLHPMQQRVVSLAFDLVSNILETGPVSL